MSANDEDRTETGRAFRASRIDAVCDQFEAAWKAGSRPSIEQFLERVAMTDRGDLLRELIALEVEFRVKEGHEPDLDEYRRRFPRDPQHVEAAFSTQTTGHKGQAAQPRSQTREPPAREALRIRCPHCRNPIELVDDKPLAEVVCPSCGSSFGVVGDEALAYQTQGGTLRRRQKFGHFELLEQLGAGAFGAVWKARDTQLDRVVALKIPRRGQLNEEEAEKFVREARAAAQLRHPNIISVHEVGREGDLLYIVSDYVEGLTLHDWLTAQRPTLREAARLCQQVAEALHYAHEHGVIHRDLKPSNILIDRSGQPYLMDFGLAKREAGEITMTVEGEILGTPAYMSPEQARGEGHTVDRRTDVYSLGATLFELLTGERPFRGNVRMLLKQVMDDEPPRPRKFDSRISRDLETICLKCLEKSPARRYGSAAELAEDLGRYLRGEAIRARPLGRLARGWRWCRRNPIVAGLAAGVAAALLAGTAVSAYFAVQAERRARQAAQEEFRATAAAAESRCERERADAKAAEAIAHAESARRHLYIAHMNLAQQAWEEPNINRLRGLLDAWQPGPAGESDLRSFEWHYWDHLCQGDLGMLTGHRGPVTSLTFGPDGNRLASGSDDHTVKIWDPDTGREILTLSGHTARITSVAFSPDGQRLASASDDQTVKLWNVVAGQEVLTCKGHGGGIAAVAFSADGKQVASGSDDRTIKIWDADTGRELLTLAGHTHRVTSVAFRPDGKRLASGGYDRTVRIWDLPTGTQVLTLKGHTNGVTSVAFSPEGDRLFSGSLDQYVALWDAATGSRLRYVRRHSHWITGVALSRDGKYMASASHDKTVVVSRVDRESIFTGWKFIGHRYAVLAVVFSPDGSRVASAGDDGVVRLWGMRTRRGGWLELESHDLRDMSVAFSPDGRRIASGSAATTVKVWDSLNGQVLLRLDGHGREVTDVAYSPDGKRLASASRDSTVKLWDTETGRTVLTFREHGDEVTSVAFSPDGKRLASAGNDRTIKVWDAASGETALTLQGHSGAVLSVAFSPDGRRLASAGDDRTIRVWDATSGDTVRTLEGHNGAVLTVAFSPDGACLASGSQDNSVKVWDATDGKELLTLNGHSLSVLSVAFSPDGKRLASGSDDHLLKLWDVPTGQEVLTLKEHTEAVLSVAFSPDGKRLTTGSWRPSVSLWEACPVTREVQLQREAAAMLASLFDKPLLKSEVRQTVESDRNVREPIRQAALALVAGWPEAACEFNRTGWKIVRKPQATSEEYLRALRLAETACRLHPENGLYLNTLGVARYRLGKHTEAIEALAKSEKLNAAGLSGAGCTGTHPGDVAFLAMAHHRLGQTEQAKERLEQLRSLLAQPVWAENAEARGFLREAEALMEGQTAPPKDAEQNRNPSSPMP